RTSSTPLFDKVLNGLKKEVRDNILINDHIPDEELPFFYKAASLFVYPSIGEGFGIPPLEAAAMETPVVCSNMLGLKQFDFFEQDHVDPRNEEAFCERVLKILSGDISMKQLESRSQYVQKVFSWKTAADSFQKLIINDHNLRTNDSIPGHRKQEGSVPAEVSHR
ncbi:MAG: glycosyltransferase, partial [Flavisolibacter sp.]|nr:glycosyltransferase [Flavisolibacter sp.]